MADQVIRITNGASLVVRTGAILGVGPQGPIGPQGPVGAQGIQGTIMFTTPTAPTSGMRDGDLWVNPSTGILSVYNATSGNWVAGSTSIKGPQGIQGPVGPTGPSGAAAAGFATYDLLLPSANRPAIP